MVDREKVIRGLQNSIDDNINTASYPYFEESRIDMGLMREVPVAMLLDALAFLKAQEPMVMTLEEAQKAEYVYLETRKWVDGDYHGTAKHKDTEFSDCLTEFVDSYGCVLSCDNAMYGDNWRCWTSRPTNEQREKVKWDE